MRPYEDDLTTTVARLPPRAAITDAARAKDSAVSASDMAMNRVSIPVSLGFALRVTQVPGPPLAAAGKILQVSAEAAVFSAAMLNAGEAEPWEEGETRVEEAARRERAARATLEKAVSPTDRDWTPEARAAYEAHLARWRFASRELVAALNRLAAERESRQRR